MSYEISITHGGLVRYTMNFVDQTGQDLNLDEGELILTFVVPETRIVAFTKTVGDGVTYDDEVTGQAELEITPDDLVDVPNEWSTLYFDATFWQDPSTPLPAGIGQLRVIPSERESATS